MGFCVILWKVGVLVICALLLLLCIPYIVFLAAYAGKHNHEVTDPTASPPVTETTSKLSTEDYVITAIAMISLIITAVIGILAVFKNSRQLLLLWIVIMGVMVLFGLLQLVLFFTNVGIIVPKSRDTVGGQRTIFISATIIIMIVAGIGFVFGFLLRWRVVRKKAAQSNFYE